MTYAAYRDRDIYLGPVTRSFSITPNDNAALAEIPRKIVADGAGDVTVVLSGDDYVYDYAAVTKTLVNDSHTASKVKATVVDTTPSIEAGRIIIEGTANGVGGVQEVLDISAGAGVYTSATLFTVITAIVVLGVDALDGGGDETLLVEWNTGGEDIVAVADLTNSDDPELSNQVTFALAAGVPLDIAPRVVLETGTDATGIKGLL